MEKISELLEAWYEKNQRNLPWRQSRDGYGIWVSEIMLQQTRVETVIPYYLRFLAALPDMKSLAEVSQDRLLKLWEGLGYYSRVRNMQKTAKICMELYNGQLPKEPKQLEKLPGIGKYTACAIASMAYGKQVCAIDGNLARVYARLFALEEDISLEKTRAHIRAIMEEDLAQDMGMMNQALMDIGAGICTPKHPDCPGCPLRQRCQAFLQKRQGELPVKKQTASRKIENKTVVVCVCEKAVFLHKRDEKGLLAGLYEFITLEGSRTKKDFPGSLFLGSYKHIFTHMEWHMKGFLLRLSQRQQINDLFPEASGIWSKMEQLKENYSIPGAFAPFLKKLEQYLEEEEDGPTSDGA